MARAGALLLLGSASLTEASLSTWIPDVATIYQDITFKPDPMQEAEYISVKDFKGMDFDWRPSDGHWSEFIVKWPAWTANNWTIPLVSVAAYFMLIPFLRWYVGKYGKWDVRNVAFYWNSFLSIFSWCGVFACVPVMVQTFLKHGLYFTCCAPASWYGGNVCGLFVGFFIYSKLFELFDTILLLLAAKPVIALQWWHHSTVLLYCWHSYSARIATGAWFACMNYTVHSIMYGYFAIMGTQYRKAVSRYAIYITLLQLLQMLVGMFVTIKAVMYQAAGEECNVNKTNSVLGLSMYASYFLLFFKLFVDNYYLKPKVDDKAAKRKASIKHAAHSLSRRMTQTVEDDIDDDGQDKEGNMKKVN